MTTNNQCDRENLRRLLNETLPESMQGKVSDHLAICPACQRELESLVAGKDWWTEAGSRLRKSSAEFGLLRIGEIDRAAAPGRIDAQTGFEKGGPGHLHASTGLHLSDELSDEIYASDFAVDFLEPSDDSSVLGRLGEYEIVEVIGRGGMGIVLKGFQKELHRFVAVKVLSPHLAMNGAARRRFAREAQATAAVVNPHVMAIHSVHANSKLPYLVMPFVDCESLQQRLDKQGPLDLKDVLRIGMQAALGLAAAHAQGLVHRDVKPANILLETNIDRVMLTDFGLARAVDDATLTRTGIIAGTPQYMSPEQANGDAVDHQSDLFSLGSVLYAMCTARPPFRAETTFGVLRRIRETDPRPIREINPDIPVWLEQVIRKLLSKTPAGRFSTATAVAVLLEQCLAHVQQPTVVALPGELSELSVPLHDQLPRMRSKPRSKGFQLAGAIAVVTLIMLWFSLPSKFKTDELPSAADAGIHKTTREDNPTNDTDLDNRSADWNQTQVELNDTDQSLTTLETSVSSDLKDEQKQANE